MISNKNEPTNTILDQINLAQKSVAERPQWMNDVAYFAEARLEKKQDKKD